MADLLDRYHAQGKPLGRNCATATADVGPDQMDTASFAADAARAALAQAAAPQARLFAKRVERSARCPRDRPGGRPCPTGARRASAGLGVPAGARWRTSRVDRRFAWLTGVALVRQSILIILDTEPGERVMRPDFGCGLSRYLMEPNTPATRAAIARDIDAALTAGSRGSCWSPSMSSATDDPSAVLVSISYTLTRDQSIDAVQVASRSP